MLVYNFSCARLKLAVFIIFALASASLLMDMHRLTLIFLLLLCAVSAYGQEWQESEVAAPLRPLDSVSYHVGVQGSFSKGKTPLWLNANKYGLSSLDETNGYLRLGADRPVSADRGRKFGLGYGVDLAVPVNYTSDFVVQQAYVEGRWLHGLLTVGAKEQPMELKNQKLSSGSQTLGINARPVPQVRLALPEYWDVPLTGNWLHLKGHIAYGMLTDDEWQQSFTHRKTKYTKDVLYHSKAGYLKIGNEETFCPWSLEMGLEMITLFGGTSYSPDSEGNMVGHKGDSGLKGFWKALFGGGHDSGEIIYKNSEGNMLGSWVMRLGYDDDVQTAALYADKFFEDHSAMFQTDYDGYGSGSNWNKRKKNRYMVYDFKDWLLGFEYNYKDYNWINDFVFEYIYTKYQSGAIYHDHTAAIPDHIGGADNYYNHEYNPPYHWGQVMGNPLYRSPVYNCDGTLEVKDNRFVAFHMGLGGNPNENLRYRLLATYQAGWGTYSYPYTKKRHNVSLMGEASYDIHSPRRKWIDGTSVTAAYGMDFGSILGGTNYGFQLTLSKSGLLKF